MNDYLIRTKYLIGEENIEILKKKKVLICGIGGVGSFVAEALARSGVGNLTIVDHDIVDSSNLNRQLMTNKNNIGELKVNVLKKHLEKISECNVKVSKNFIDDNFEIEENYDYAIDCIDTLTSKFSLIKKCHEKEVPIISSLGSGKRIDSQNIKHTTLDKTRNDPLAKALRQLTKKERYNKKIEVVFFDKPSIHKTITKEGNTRKEKYPIGSTIFPVGAMGLYIAEIVFKKLIELKNM